MLNTSLKIMVSKWLLSGRVCGNDPIDAIDRGMSPDYIARFNYSNVIRTLEGNLHDIRLTFRWPVLPNGEVGPGRQVYRTMVGGWLLGTNDFSYPTYGGVSNFLYFFQPRTYVQVP